MKKILMVCLGNICRSPLAEGILQSKLNPSLYYVDSAGTGNWHVGEHPDKRSIQIANKYGIDISKQKCRQFNSSDFEQFDLIYVMDQSNYKNVIKLAPNKDLKNKVQLILNEQFPNKNLDIPDPFWGNIDDFDQVYKMLDEVCEIISAKLKLSL